MNSHDQNFKNLILDYPRESLMFFAAEEAMGLDREVKITPIRQEQLKDRLGDHFHELDTPLMVEWPDESRAAILFVAEEETEPDRFSIHRTARYCLHLSEMFETNRVVPVVIFLRHGSYPATLALSGDRNTYLFFQFVTCDLGRIPAEQHMDAANIVARLNLPNMAYPKERRIDVYAAAREGLVDLEQNPEKRMKYAEFIDIYANLDETDMQRYKNEYLPKSQNKEVFMGLMQMEREEGRQEGRLEGRQEGRQEGRLEGRQEGRQEGAMFVLNRLLLRRFKTIPAWAEDLLKKAEKQDLEIWTDRILEASTIEEVFKTR